MGAWGPALFSDDLACDIRDDFKELIGEGMSPQNATEELTAVYEEEINDIDEGSVFWLSLSSIQWSTGRLLEEVKQKALSIIENGADLHRWSEDKKLFEKRKQVLEKLKFQLLSPQPKSKKLPKIYKENSLFNIGDLFSYRHSTGNYALLRVIGIHQDKGGRSAVCELLDFFEREIDTFKDFSSTPIKAIDNPHSPITKFMVAEVSAKYAPNHETFKLIAANTKPVQISRGYSVLFWRDMDKHLSTAFENKK
ncbi:hypothetical protein [Rufibacter roseus]|uniref:DUF4259 domain-containing protein n=1 Tax=Rufibacter roseus TaxID=1567108 RepID=A0ABW2DP11_9BACT|nr:hypothetical protein [Rufibacter roseus]